VPKGDFTVAVVDSAGLEVGVPNENPLGAAASVLRLGVPKVKPPPVAAAGVIVADPPPKINPPDPVLLVVAAAAAPPPPNLKPPPAPMVMTGCAASFILATSSSQPGWTVSQAGHLILELSILEKQPWHSQLEAFWALAISAILFGALVVVSFFVSAFSFSGDSSLTEVSPSSSRPSLAFSTISFQLLAISEFLNLRQNISALSSPSLKSWAVQVKALSEETMGLISRSAVSRWLQHSFNTCSRLIRNLTFPVFLFL